ncbi:hypothetical protein CLOM_g14523 [Closterium sp. NIES-68]|nr:hypothetical protein CLOM_g14523 [Closterium sp. NIES-68]
METTPQRTPPGRGSDTKAFVKELQAFFETRHQEFKVPKFYGVEVDLLKLWQVVCSFGGFDKVTSGKLWRVVGDQFDPPKSCTTLSWSFRGFYEKALLEYERHVGVDPMLEGTLAITPRSDAKHHGGQERRHLREHLGQRPEQQTRPGPEAGLWQRGRHTRGVAVVNDLGLPADWVRINVRRSPDCFEIYALVPGLLREEVRVQCEPAGKLVIAGEPEQPDNPWGVTPFKKVILLPAAINANQTSAVVTLHGQLYVRAPLAHPGPPALSPQMTPIPAPDLPPPPLPQMGGGQGQGGQGQGNQGQMGQGQGGRFKGRVSKGWFLMVRRTHTGMGM